MVQRKMTRTPQQVLMQSTRYEELFDAIDQLLEVHDGDEKVARALDECSVQISELQSIAEDIEAGTLDDTVAHTRRHLEELAELFSNQMMRLEHRARTIIRRLDERRAALEALESSRHEATILSRISELERRANRTCRACGAGLVVRQNSTDASYFWGCSRFGESSCMVSFNLSREEEASLTS